MNHSGPHIISRRSAATLLAGALLSPSNALSFASPQARTRQNLGPQNKTDLTQLDVTFLDDMQHAGSLYFSEQADPATGQVLDRAINHTATGALDSRTLSSVAATGFGLTALCIADKRSWLGPGVAARQVLTTLQFHLSKMPHQHGFFYHFNNVRTGQPYGKYRGLVHRYVDTSMRRAYVQGVLQRRKDSMTWPRSSITASTGHGCSMAEIHSPWAGIHQPASSRTAGTTTVS